MAAQDILFIDAYDSFTYNIVSLLAEILPIGPDAQIVVQSLHDPLPGLQQTASDVSDDVFAQYLRGFSAVVCGPGPGSPLNPQDVGPFSRIWSLSDENMIPVLGICLGLQSLVSHFGGRIRKLKLGQHGIIRAIEHQGERQTGATTEDIFEGVKPFKATLYHSLCADIGQDQIPEEEWPAAKWATFPSVPDLQPLAWTTIDLSDASERVLMGVKHRSKPFWALQYHPESICTESASRRVLQNWYKEALAWSQRTGRQSHHVERPGSHSGHGTLPTAIEARIGGHLANHSTADDIVFADDWLEKHRPDLASTAARDYVCAQLDLPDGVDAASIADILGETSGSRIILDASSARVKDPLAVQSIVAIGVDNAIRFEHVAKSGSSIRMFVPGSGRDGAQVVDLKPTGDIQAWEIVSHFWSARSCRDADKMVTSTGQAHDHFKGGFMGYLSYEMGLKTVSPELARAASRSDNHTDLCMAWVTHSVVLEHKSGKANVQAWGTKDEAASWVKWAVEQLQDGFRKVEVHSSVVPSLKGKERISHLRLRTPDPAVYEEKVRQCQREIAEGNSYELCLTAQTIMTRPSMVDDAGRGNGHYNGFKNANGNGTRTPWEIYKALRSRQPAPFGSFICLGGAMLLSSSPERFLQYSKDGLCSMRPMKGTVRKSKAVSTLADAEKMLRIPKEIAENLMIVDLVRHDLHRVCGSGQVTVPEPFKIEEYATVFTMVTGIQGQLNRYIAGPESQESPPAAMTGLDVLRSVFPPGSMTGAPKKRSCELLAEIEGHQPRGLYSGVVGYMDVTGAGDWSVTIRSMFRYDDEMADPEPGETVPREVWHIGAGGAVTILSTPEGEREEMFTKLEGPLGIFRDVA
ncbi:hypothetical protein NLU13_9366 [Sarocladium strictum]|uniref:aminodeoxychorismate synthase n=1 Tax=Sarocladium strictum TaxID=5046 RepID=A0AA39GA06_SARSR|nr:hypothetical protein NLU13_9366 [Sarocladium strictum]